MKLIRANINDCEKIWKMQKEAFADLLEKYKNAISKINLYPLRG
jgi:hypothetical protein